MILRIRYDGLGGLTTRVGKILRPRGVTVLKGSLITDTSLVPTGFAMPSLVNAMED